MDGQQGQLAKIAKNLHAISEWFSAFRNKMRQSSKCDISYNTIHAFGTATPEFRREQIRLLENALILEEENCRLARVILG